MERVLENMEHAMEYSVSCGAYTRLPTRTSQHLASS